MPGTPRRRAWLVGWMVGGLSLCLTQPVLAQSAPLLSAADSSRAAERLLNEAALALRSVGPDSSTRVYRAAQALIPKSDSALAVRAECAEQQVALQTRRRIADSVWTRLRRAAEFSPRLSADCGFIQARYLESLGFRTEVLRLLDTVATNFARVEHWQNLSAVRQWQGTMHIAAGNYGLARDRLDTALVLARRAGSLSGEGWALQEYGRMTQRLGAPDDAARYFAAALSRFEQINDRLGVLYAKRALAEGLLLQGRLTEAESALVQVTAQARVLAPAVEVFNLVSLADLNRQMGRGTRSDTLLDSAQRLAQLRNTPGWMSEILYQRAVRDIQTRRFSAAQARLDSLLARRIQGPARFETLMRKSEAFALAGAFDSAAASFTTARVALDRWRSGFRDRFMALSVLQDRAFDWDRDLGVATMIDAHVRAGRVPEALAMAEWRRVRGQEQQALQRNGLKIAGDGATTVRVAAVDEGPLDAARLPRLARVALPPSRAVVSWVVGRGGEPGTAFVITADRVQAVTLPSIDSLQATLTALPAFLEAGELPLPLVARVSAELWAPVAAALPPGVRELQLVPDGALHRLPFGALPHGNGRLQDQLVLSYATSVEEALGAVPRIARRATSTGPVLIGAPLRAPAADSSQPLVREWVPLPGAREEIRSLSRKLDGARVYVGERATADAFERERKRGGTVLHLATHATASAQSYNRTAVALEPTTTHNGVLQLSEFAGRPLPFDLVVLSACASADGVAQVGQGLHGLVSAALDAGARGVVATRWDVSDADMTRFMLALYDSLQVEPNVPRALAAVRRQFAAEGRSPAVWAGVEYYGAAHLEVRLAARRPSFWSRLVSPFARWFGGRD